MDEIQRIYESLAEPKCSVAEFREWYLRNTPYRGEIRHALEMLVDAAQEKEDKDPAWRTTRKSAFKLLRKLARKNMTRSQKDASRERMAEWRLTREAANELPASVQEIVDSSMQQYGGSPSMPVARSAPVGRAAKKL